MKKVLIITYYWPPSGGPGVQRALKFVKYLSESGIAPFVLTVDENQASYPLTDDSLLKDIPAQVPVRKTRSFEALKILSAFTSKKNIPHGGFANRGSESVFQKALRFIRGNFFIPDARKGWVPYAVEAATELIEKENIGTVVISSPPHSSQLIGLKLKKKFPALNWVADMRDPWTDIYYYKDLMHTRSAAARDAAYEASVLETADHVISVSEPICKLLLKKSPRLSPSKFHVIPNGFDEPDFSEDEKPEPGKFVFTYVGTMSAAYKPQVLFGAIEKLAQKHRDVKMELRMVGTHAGAVKELVDESHLSAITTFIPQVDHGKAVGYMLRSDILLLVIPDVEHSEGILTGKLFEYLGSRRPVAGLGPVPGDAARILAECEAGKMFNRKQSAELEQFLESLLERWRRGEDTSNPSTAYHKYSRKELTKQLASYL